VGQVTQARYSSLLKRLFALKTVDPGASVGPFVAPSCEVNDAYLPEARALRGEKLFTGSTAETNTAAVNFGVAQFGNPIGSGKVAVVRRVIWSFATPTAANQPGNFRLQLSQQAGTAPAPTIFGTVKDSRYGGGLASQSTCGVQNANTGISGFPATALYQVVVVLGAAAGSVLHVADNLDIVVWPGFAFNISAVSDILPVGTYTWFATWECYERAFDPSELIVPP